MRTEKKNMLVVRIRQNRDGVMVEDGKKRLVILELQGELALFNGSMKKKGEKIGDISLDPVRLSAVQSPLSC